MGFSLDSYIDEQRKKRKDEEDKPVTGNGTGTDSGTDKGSGTGKFDLDDYVIRRGIQRGTLNQQDDDFNAWVSDVGSFSQRMSDDYSRREGMYQSPDSFRTYQTQSGNEVSELLGRAYNSRSYYTQYADLYDEVYGEGTSQQLLDGIEQNISYLQGVNTNLQGEYDYWAQFPTQADYDTFLRVNSYAELPNAADFAEKSIYDAEANSTGVERERWDPETDSFLDLFKVPEGVNLAGTLLTGEGGGIVYDDTGYKDLLLAYINGDETAGAIIRNNDANTYGAGSGALGRAWAYATEGSQESQHMTDDEIALFNYLYNTQGSESAYEYYAYIKSDLYARNREADEAMAAQWAQESPVSSSIFSVLMSPAKGLSYLMQGAEYLGTGSIDQNAPYNKFSYIPTAIREEVSTAIEESGNWGSVGSFAYNTGMSMADFLFNTAISGGNQALTLGIMGTGAAADATIAGKDAGLDDTRAFVLGTVAGAAEIITEKFSLDALFDTSTLGKSAFRYMVKNALVEGSEEVGSDAINWIADDLYDLITSQDQSEWKRMMDAYMEEGMTEQEAFYAALAERGKTVALDFAGGFVSGGVMSGGGVAIDAGTNITTGRNFNSMNLSAEDINAFIEEGLASDPSTLSYQLAEAAQRKIAAGGTLTDYELGRLYRQNAAAIQSEESGAALLEQAAREVAGGGSVTNRMANSILGNVNAVNSLTQEAGLALTKDMSKSQRRAAVKSAVASLASRSNGTTEGGATADTRNTAQMAHDAKNVAGLTREMGTAGAQVIQQMYDPVVSAAEYFPAMNAYYQAGMKGESMDAVQGSRVLSAQQAEAAYIAGQEDARNAAATENEMEAVNNGEEVYLRDSGQRTGSAYPGGALSPVAESTGGASVRQAQSVPADAGAASLSYGQKVSTASLGIGGGSTEANIRLVTGGETAATGKAKALAKERGLRLTLFTGDNLRIRQKDGSWASVRAYVSGDRVFVRADHSRYTADQLMRHEAGHDMIAKGEVDPDAVRERINETFGQEKADALAQLYTDAYEGSDMTAEEIWEEVICDSLGDMNIFSDTLSEELAAELLTETKKATAPTETVTARGPPFASDTNVGGKYSLDDSFAQRIDRWLSSGKQNAPGSGRFTVGTTSDALKSIGVKDYKIYWSAAKIAKIMKDHPGMTAEVIKSVPQILENPVLVMQSQTVANRITLFGEVLDAEGLPVLAALELKPQSKSGEVQDFATVASAYGKNGAQTLIDNSDILYVDPDKKRTDNWLKLLRLHLPSRITNYGPIGSVTLVERDVNGNISVGSTEGKTAMQEAFERAQAKAKAEGKFSMETPVEESGGLIAVHNMDAEKLARTLRLGAWPSPSIAVVQADAGHSNYGEYSALFRADTIDPQADSRNRVYGSDAWTPTHNNAVVESEVDYAKKREFERLIEDLSRDIGGGAFNRGSVLGRAGIEDSSRKSLREIAEQIAKYPDAQAAYLATQGEDVEVQRREKSYHRFGNEAVRRFANSMTVQELAALDMAVETRDQATIEAVAQQVKDVARDAYADILRNRKTMSGKPISEEVIQKRLDKYVDDITDYHVESFIQAAWEMSQDGANTGEIDRGGMAEALNNMVDKREVAKWAEGLLDGLFVGEGVYNGEDIYTDNGRKDFSETHVPVTAENIVEAMYRENGSRGVGAYALDASGLQSSASPSYQSIEDIRADSHRLGRVSEEELHSLEGEVNDRLSGLYDKLYALPGASAYNLSEAVLNAASLRYVDEVIRSFEQDGIRAMTEGTALELIETFEMAAQLPTEYFEAKPERVVSFDEAVAVFAPSDAPANLVDSMRDAGMNVVLYEAGNEADRLAKINEMADSTPGAKFSRELDSVGNQLTEAQAEYFADSEVRDSRGQLKVMYQGGTGDFTVFDRRMSSYSNLYGRGFYFTDSESHATQYGSARAFYLNITNPVPTTRRTITRPQMLSFLEAVAANEDEYSFENYGYGATPASVLRSVFSGKSDFAMLYDVSQTAIGDMVEAVELFNRINGTSFDGLILDTETVTFRSEQAKRTDNKNPTSAPDIRYSRELESIESLREQNGLLRDKLEAAKGQLKRTTAENRTVRQADIDKLARGLIKSYGSGLTTADISAELKALGDFLVRGGEELTWTAVKDRAVGIAQDIIENAEVLNDEQYQQYSDLRKYLKDTKLTLGPKYKGDIPDFGDFRKRNFGRLPKLSIGDHTNIDQVYEEMSSMWPEFFDSAEQTHPTDQLLHIVDVLDSLQPVYENPHSYYMAEAVEGLANEIIDGLISEDVRQTPPTFADRQAAKLDQQKAKDAAKLDKLRAQKNERIAELRKQGQERTKAALKKVRADRDAKIKALKEGFRAKEAKGRESRKAASLRARIQKHVRDLSGELLRPNDKHHVPEALRGPVARLLEAINLESNYELEYGRDAKYHRVKPGESLYSEVTKRTQAFAELKKAYQEIGGELVIDPDLLGGDGVSGLLDEVAAMADKPIASMNSTELETVWQTLRAVEASIRTANKMFAAARFQTVSEAAEALRRDNDGKKQRTEYGGPKDILGKIQKLTTLDMMTPEAFMHRLGNSGDAIFRMLRDAQDEHIRMMKQVADFTHEALSGVNVRALEKEMHTVKLGGEDVKLSTAQLMELYVLMRREQAQAHIFAGGILPDTVSTGRLKKASRAEPLRGVTIQEVADALSLLTAEQTAMAEKLQDYASTTLSDFGNKASMEVYNYKKFMEEHYWPIRSNRQETKSTVEKDTQVTSVANRGFTKATKPNADTSVRLGSIFDTFATHASEMATYAAWLGTTEDVNRIRNFTFRDGEGNRSGTVKGIIDRVHGSQGSGYLQKLLSDIANGVKGTHGETDYMAGLTGNYKASAVGANLRVIIQQPTAILRAMDMISPKYMAQGFKPGGWKKAKQYAPIAQWKDWGYFDIHTGRQMKDVLFDSDSAVEKIKQAAMWGAGKMDSLAWGHLWNAVETETKATNKELKPGTRDFYEAVAKRFNQIIDRTQVVDGILQRSQIMRSANPLNKMASAFMGEPTKQYNMMLTSAYDATRATSKTARTAAQKRLARTVFALGVSGVINAAAQSIMDAVRDDDKEKGYWEKWTEAFTGFSGDEEGFAEHFGAFWSGNLENVINVANYIPYAKDVVSIIQGYDVSRMDMDSISNTIAAAQNFLKALGGEGKYTVAGASANFFAEGARLLGIPVSNFKREVLSFAMLAAVESDSYLMQYRLEKASLNMNYSGNRKNFMGILYNAYVNDPEAYELIYADMVKSGYKPSDIQSNMEDRMKADQGVKSVDDLESRYLTPDQQSTYDRTMNTVRGSSIWSDATAGQQDKVEDYLYDLIVGNSDGVEMQEKIDGGADYGIDEADYLLYKLALSMADENGNSSFTQEETQAAIDMLGLDRDASSYLWQSTNSGWKASNNPYN